MNKTNNNSNHDVDDDKREVEHWSRTSRQQKTTFKYFSTYMRDLSSVCGTSRACVCVRRVSVCESVSGSGKSATKIKFEIIFGKQNFFRWMQPLHNAVGCADQLPGDRRHTIFLMNAIIE